MPAQAFDLPSAFDEPCMGGMGILADICNAINDLHDFAHGQEARTDSLNATQIVQQGQIDSLNSTQLAQQIQIDSNNATNIIQTDRIDSFNPTQITQQGEINANEALHIIQTNRLNSLNTTQILELIAQDIAEAQLAALPLVHYVSLQDSNDADCEDGGPLGAAFAIGWCPIEDEFLPLVFNITDSNILFDSMLFVKTIPPVTGTGCPFNIQVGNGSFKFNCVGEVEGTILQYLVINP